MELKVKGIDLVITRMERRKQKLLKTNFPIARTLTEWFNFVQDNFKSEGLAHTGRFRGWKKLAKSTVETRRRKKQFPIKILDISGKLKQAWAFASPRKNIGILKSLSNISAIHDKGSKNTGKGKKVRIPQRKILPGIKDAKRIALRFFKQHVKFSIRL